jgi:flagella basal body P-ring formation protein FlgA
MFRFFEIREMLKTVRILTAACRGRRVADGHLIPAPYIGVVPGLLALLIASVPAHAATATQSLADIEKAAESFLAREGTVGTARATPLDRRLRLAQCDRPLQAFTRAGAQVRQRTIVGVRCSGTQPWKVYVPVNLVATRNVVVLKRALPRGHELQATDLVLHERDVSRLAGGYATEPANVVGQRLRQSLQAGSIVTPRVLASKVLVRRGQSVTLRASNEAINIRVAGKALMDGALGQRIRVENSGSGRVVEGLVRSAELVEILVQ